MLSLDFLLELKETIHESLCSGGTARNININGDNPVTASDHGVTVMIVSTPIGAAAHAHHPAGLRHLVIDLPEGGGHLVGQGPGHNDDISLAGRGSEHNTISDNDNMVS